MDGYQGTYGWLREEILLSIHSKGGLLRARHCARCFTLSLTPALKHMDYYFGFTNGGCPRTTVTQLSNKARM